MSRCIDAEWLLRFFEPYHDGYHTPLGVLRACVDDAPSIDIVRCKECKYGDVLDHYESGCCGCKNGLLGYITADDFCSYGERKDDE